MANVGEASIYSSVPQSLKKIYEAHWETGNEVNSKSGDAIRKAQRVALNSRKTHWNIEYSEAKAGNRVGQTIRKFVYSPTARPMGDIVDRSGRILSTRLDNLIQSRTSGAKGVTVVTAPMKKGKTEIRRDGKVVSSTKVDNVGRNSIDILQKINYGLNSNSSKINRVNNSIGWDNGKPSLDKFRGKHKATNFIEEGRRNALSKVNGYITTGFQDALTRRDTSVTTIRVA